MSTGNKDIKPEDAAKQRQEIEAETKVRGAAAAAVVAVGDGDDDGWLVGWLGCCFGWMAGWLVVDVCWVFSIIIYISNTLNMSFVWGEFL